MSFENGESGNPNGRPKGSYGGRIMALASLDTLLAKKKNQKALMAALEQDLLEDPVRFFKTVIMPLLPREAKLSFDHDGVIQWKSLLGGMSGGNDPAPIDVDSNPHSSPLPSQGAGVVTGQNVEA
jgi:hypothetical protein